MPENWVSGEALTVEAQLAHEKRANEQLRQAYRAADTGRTEAQTKLRQMRLALEALVERMSGFDVTGTEAANRIQEVLDDFAS